MRGGAHGKGRVAGGGGAHQLGDLALKRAVAPLLQPHVLLEVAENAPLLALPLRQVERARPLLVHRSHRGHARLRRPHAEPHHGIVQLLLLFRVLHPRGGVRVVLRDAALSPLVARHVLVRLGVVWALVVERERAGLGLHAVGEGHVVLVHDWRVPRLLSSTRTRPDELSRRQTRGRSWFGSECWRLETSEKHTAGYCHPGTDWWDWQVVQHKRWVLASSRCWRDTQIRSTNNMRSNRSGSVADLSGCGEGVRVSVCYERSETAAGFSAEDLKRAEAQWREQGPPKGLTSD